MTQLRRQLAQNLSIRARPHRVPDVEFGFRQRYSVTLRFCNAEIFNADILQIAGLCAAGSPVDSRLQS